MRALWRILSAYGPPAFAVVCCVLALYILVEEHNAWARLLEAESRHRPCPPCP